jgi:hypothetical protein
MEMRLALAVLVLAVAAASQLSSATQATNYTVGGEKGWNPKVDYTAWPPGSRSTGPSSRGIGSVSFLLPASSSSCCYCSSASYYNLHWRKKICIQEIEEQLDLC